MKTCGTCKHRGPEIVINEWDDDFDDQIEKQTGFFRCQRIKHMGDQYDPKTPGEGAGVVDGSGYFAALCVEDDFGCVKWELKE